MIRNNYCVYVMLKKSDCVLDYLLDIFQTAVMRFRLLQHYERHYKTTEPKFPIKSIGDFTVSDTQKPPQRKKKYR